MSRWARIAAEQANVKDVQSANAWKDFNDRNDRIRREAPIFWSELREHLTDDAGEIESVRPVGLMVSKGHENPGPNGIVLERAKQPDLGCVLSLSSDAALFTGLFYVKQPAATREGFQRVRLQRTATIFHLNIHPETDELCAVVKVGKGSGVERYSPKDLSRELLQPFVTGDRREMPTFIER